MGSWSVETIEEGGNTPFGITIINNASLLFSMEEPLITDISKLNVFSQDANGNFYPLEYLIAAYVNLNEPNLSQFEFDPYKNIESSIAEDDQPNTQIVIINIETGQHLFSSKSKGILHNPDKPDIIF